MSDILDEFNKALEGLDEEFADSVVSQIQDDQRAVDLILDRLMQLYADRATAVCEAGLHYVSVRHVPGRGWRCMIQQSRQAGIVLTEYRTTASLAVNGAIGMMELHSEEEEE